MTGSKAEQRRSSRWMTPNAPARWRQHEQAAGSPAVVSDDRGLHSELIGRGGVTFADAFYLRGMEGIERPSALTLLLRADLAWPGRAGCAGYATAADAAIDDKTGPCCQGELHRIGEDRSERLDLVPAQFRILVTRRPKYACRACEDGVIQVPVPAQLIEGGLPTEATVAHVLASKYADHLPLHRQAQIYARHELDRSTLADWVGQAAFHLRPLQERLLGKLKQRPKLFADETTMPVLDPGRGRTKTGQLWAYAADDRPWGGADPPGVAYVYAPDRKADRPIVHLVGFKGILQVDGYAGYAKLAERRDIELAFCWAHMRRNFYELATPGPAPIASEALIRAEPMR